MVDFNISLPKAADVHKPNLKNDVLIKMSDDAKLALFSFDTDKNKGSFSSEELLDAFNYFCEKEKAVGDKKGDRVISSKDLEQLIKTDPRFEQLRAKYKNDDAKAAEALSKVLLSISMAVNTESYKDKQMIAMGDGVAEFQDNNTMEISLGRSLKYTKSDLKTVDGKQVKVCESGNGEYYVLSADGKHRYTTPDYVAKCLGYQKESTWFGLGEDKYYSLGSERGYQRVGDGGHEVSEQIKQYKIWDAEQKCFIDGDIKRTGNETHYVSSR